MTEKYYFVGFSAPKPPVCEAGLGLESYAIPDSSVTASSWWGPHKPGNARLHLYVKPGNLNVRGGWEPMPGNKKNSWFQVDFGNWAKVTIISTQGSPLKPQWVTKYLVTYSYDGLFYKDYSKVTTCHLDLLKIIFT